MANMKTAKDKVAAKVAKAKAKAKAKARRL